MASIVVSELYRKGVPRGEEAPVIRQWEGGGLRSSLSVFAESEDHVHAVVSQLLPGTGLQEFRQVVAVVWKPLNYGGARPAFICPACWRPVRRLYLHRSLSLRCQRCADLRYASRSRGSRGSLEAQVRKLRARLGGPALPGGPLPLRPRGMHRRTYQRLYDELCELEAALYPMPKTVSALLAAWEYATSAARQAESEEQERW